MPLGLGLQLSKAGLGVLVGRYLGGGVLQQGLLALCLRQQLQTPSFSAATLEQLLLARSCRQPLPHSTAKQGPADRDAAVHLCLILPGRSAGPPGTDRQQDADLLGLTAGASIRQGGSCTPGHAGNRHPPPSSQPAGPP